jgi:hypothetical protein
MTSTITILPIIAALFTANNFEQIKDVRWCIQNAEQKIFVQNYWPNVADLNLLKDDEIKSKASRDVKVVNQFLQDNGFSIELTDLKNPLAFYVASILNVNIEWKELGEKTTLKVCEKEYPAVEFEKEESQPFKVFKVLDDFSSFGQDSEILEIEAKNGDLVYMLQDNKKSSPFTGFALLDAIKNIWQKNIVSSNEICYDKAIFPMVDIDQEVDIKWLEKIRACDGYKEVYEIAQALQQTKFQMNEKGAKVKSAVAISCIECSCAIRIPKIFTINDSFYLWILRPGMKTPIFAAYIDKDAWKVPVE